MTNTQSFAAKEFDILTATHLDPNDRPIIEEFREEILALCEKFGQSGQSGGSAPYTASAISQAVKKLCLQQPIAPITGTDDEWMEPFSGGVFQNTRCSALFKGLDGKPYYLNAIVWQGEDQYDTFSGTLDGICSRQYIQEFPFTPKTFYVNVYRVPYIEGVHKASDAVSCGSGDFVYFIKDKSKLDEVFAYYDFYNPNQKSI